MNSGTQWKIQLYNTNVVLFFLLMKANIYLKYECKHDFQVFQFFFLYVVFVMNLNDFLRSQRKKHIKLRILYGTHDCSEAVHAKIVIKTNFYITQVHLLEENTSTSLQVRYLFVIESRQAARVAKGEMKI